MDNRRALQVLLLVASYIGATAFIFFGTTADDDLKIGIVGSLFGFLGFMTWSISRYTKSLRTNSLS